MRQFTFRYIIPVPFTVDENGEVPITFDMKYHEIAVFHYDYFMARAIADLLWNTWRWKHGY